jgi:hypothetical protein
MSLHLIQKARKRSLSYIEEICSVDSSEKDCSILQPEGLLQLAQ